MPITLPELPYPKIAPIAEPHLLEAELQPVSPRCAKRARPCASMSMEYWGGTAVHLSNIGCGMNVTFL